MDYGYLLSRGGTKVGTLGTTTHASRYTTFSHRFHAIHDSAKQIITAMTPLEEN
jgi:hypothetical protein